MKCIGFGEFEGKCENEAEGSDRNPFWCNRCDTLRVDHINRQFDDILDKMQKKVEKEIK